MYEVWVERVASLGRVPGPEVFWMDHFGESLDLAVHILIIRGQGRTMLVNTGPPLDYLDHMNAVWREELGPATQISVSPDQRIDAILARHQIAPEMVDAVVLTPLQAYAVGNVDRFPKAKICVSRTGWVDLFAPRFFDARRHMAVPDRMLQHLLFEAWPEQRIRLLDDEEEIAPGIRTWWAGTHHRSSLAVTVDTERGPVGFSDVVFYYQNLEEDRPLGIQESLEECKIAYHRLRTSTACFVSAYDPTTLDRFPGGQVSVAKDRGQQGKGGQG
ncbi:MAG: hypothetical protein M1600_04385 [Firmicutes bacterium]|nr:hypothetical protein [Bacillota bacterium]